MRNSRSLAPNRKMEGREEATVLGRSTETPEQESTTSETIARDAEKILNKSFCEEEEEETPGQAGSTVECSGGEGEKDDSKRTQEVTQSVTSNSIYLEDGENCNQTRPPPAKPRRLTRAERARQEALASFGGSDFASVTVKKRDLREELKKEVQEREKREAEERSNRHKTRLQAAKEEAMAVFKDIPVGGESLSTNRKRKLPADDTDSSSNPKVARRTKAEQARLEALQSFGGCGLDVVLGGAKRKVARTLDARKRKDKDEEGEEEVAEKENSAQ